MLSLYPTKDCIPGEDPDLDHLDAATSSDRYFSRFAISTAEAPTYHRRRL